MAEAYTTIRIKARTRERLERHRTHFRDTVDDLENRVLDLADRELERERAEEAQGRRRERRAS